MQEAYVGIDVVFAKNKRLPIAVVVRSRSGLEPLSLRRAQAKPPGRQGNVCILHDDIVGEFAEETAAYTRSVESEFGIRLAGVAIDAPSAPKAIGPARRQCESALDERKISCKTTPGNS